jgi:hypothetical protein
LSFSFLSFKTCSIAVKNPWGWQGTPLLLDPIVK